MDILLIHSKEDIREMVAFPLEEAFSATTHRAANVAQTKEIIAAKKLQPVLVVAENSPENCTVLPEILGQGGAKVILCDTAAPAKSPPTVPETSFLGYALYSDLVANIMDLIRAKAPEIKSPEAAAAEPYCRINTSLLLKLNPLAADIYIRLSPIRFVKLFNQNDTFDQGDLEKYRDKKGVEYLYILKEDSKLLVGKLLGELERILRADAVSMPKEVKQDVMADMVDTVHELIQKVGVTEEVQKAVQQSVAVAMQTMGEFPDLAEVLKQVQDPNAKYIGRHSILLANIACSLAVCMDWYSENTFQKLTTAAFMHDAPLRNHDLCAVKDLSEFEKKYKGKFNLAQIQEYKNHPNAAVLLLGHFKDLPPEVDKIVVQHHEHPMGTGFPGALSGNYITPLSALFIVSHDLTDWVLDNKGELDMDEFLGFHSKKYTSGNFKKIAKQLSEVALF